VESPRNSGWFLCAVAARRALTFLEKQPEVDPDRLGVYGHSMGGKLTVMTAVDQRVKAAAPSCGGISDRDNASPLYRSTIGDNVSLKEIRCPIIFLSPSNDFHGRLGDLPKAIREIQSDVWRVTCSPHHNHQDTPEYEAATLLWFDQHLRNSFRWPANPATALNLKTTDGVPSVTVTPDQLLPIEEIDVFYTVQGQDNEGAKQRLETMHRFWRHAVTERQGDTWTARLPLSTTSKPLWVFANVRYKLDRPYAGVGYYYGDYQTRIINLSSLVTKVPAADLMAADVKPVLKPTLVIEDFQQNWKKEWYTYRPSDWGRSTNKLNSKTFRAPPGAHLALSLTATHANQIAVRLDDHVAEVSVTPGTAPQQIRLAPQDFTNYAGDALTRWQGIRQLTISAQERLRPERGQSGQPRIIGGESQGPPPEFHRLEWTR
jgi:hypothetical protein